MRKYLVILVLLAALCAFTGCHQLPNSFDETTVISRGEEVILVANSGDWQALAQMFRPDLQESITAEYLSQQLDAIFDGAGDFEKIKGRATAGVKDEATGEMYAMVAIKCIYSEKKLTYTLSFDKDLYLVGFFVK